MRSTMDSGMVFLGDWLTARAVATPRHPALLFGALRWDYHELDRDVGQMAGWLSEMGVRRNAHVGVLMENSPEYVMLVHAVARIGAVLIPLNCRLTAEEVNYQIEFAEIEFVVAAERDAHHHRSSSKGVRWLPVSKVAKGNARPILGNRESHRFNAIQSLVFTSGTTGRPKAVMLTFGNLFFGAFASMERLGLFPSDKWLICMPIYHVGGMSILWRACLSGFPVELQPSFREVDILNSIEHSEVTIVSLVPTMLARLVRCAGGPEALRRLRIILLGGAAANEELLGICRDMKLNIALTYGLTEAASQVATSTLEDWLAGSNSVGRPMFFNKIKITGEDGDEVARGEVGEIRLAGPTVMTGYFRDGQATEEVLVDGELRTGDLGYQDAGGNLFVVQRRKDLIVSGGENVYPAEVERVLAMHPGVKEVCVVGVDDAEWGQRVAAAVVARDGQPQDEQSLEAHCRKSLAGFKRPRRYLFLEQLPMTVSGKVDRAGIKELMAETLGVSG